MRHPARPSAIASVRASAPPGARASTSYSAGASATQPPGHPARASAIASVSASAPRGQSEYQLQGRSERHPATQPPSQSECHSECQCERPPGPERVPATVPERAPPMSHPPVPSPPPLQMASEMRFSTRRRRAANWQQAPTVRNQEPNPLNPHNAAESANSWWVRRWRHQHRSGCSSSKA